MRKLDVLVVGAGPAGSATALALARKGVKVLILEKAPAFPRHKPCGGAVPRGAFQRLGLTPPPLTLWPRAARFQEGDHLLAEIPIPRGAVALTRRDLFDLWLLEHALEAGAEVRVGVEVREVWEEVAGVQVALKGGERLRAAYLVAADGVHSRTARRAGLGGPKATAGALEATVPAASPQARALVEGRTALFRFGDLDYGYLWAFPGADGVLSVGAVDFSGAQGRRLRPALNAFLRRELALDPDRAPWAGHVLPLFSRRPLHTRRVVAVGDAAGLVDPLLGEGIRYGIRSGLLAAEALVQEAPELYTTRLLRELLPAFRAAYLAAFPFYRIPGIRPWVLRRPGLVAAFARVLAEEEGYGAFLASLPFVLLR